MMRFLEKLLPFRDRDRKDDQKRQEEHRDTIFFPLPEPPEGFDDRLSPAQREAVRSPFARTLVVAGPGAGKTLTLVKRAQYMLERGIPGQEMALITFTRKAAEEMRSRLQVLAGEKASAVFVGTFHSYALHLLRTAGLDVDLLDENQALKLLQNKQDPRAF